jgi:putative PIN family toxin of toxin-antitoxin system
VKLVTDTNVVVSGLLWLGNPGRLLEAAANGQVTLYTSPALAAELRSTLAYDRLARYVQRSGLTLDELVTRYLNVAILVQPSAVPRIVANDADDDHVLACALEAHADLIVSGDHHLLDLNDYHGIPIVKAAEALRRVETQK